MAPFDPASPLTDVSTGEPCGPNLEFDPEFAELERLAQGKPEQQYGATVVEAVEPEWREVGAAARSLLERTHDLRVMTHLAAARLHAEGLQGYADTLATVARALEDRWEQVHPQLDPEDDNDPTLRANALLGLAGPVHVMRFLRHMPLARSPRAGPVSWRDVAIATGALEVDDAERMSESVIGGAFRDADPVQIEAVKDALQTSIAGAVAIPAAFDGRCGHGTGPDFTDLLKLLRDMQRVVGAYAPAAYASAADPQEPEAAGEPAARVFAAPARLGPPATREDAVRMLDFVIEYFERHEPSSPVPLLVARARRLVDKSFMDLLRDMAPDGLQQAERIAGTGE